MAIHPTALVDPDAELDASVEVGPFAVIGPRVRIDARTTVGAHAVIEGRTRIGKRNRIFQFAALGAIPQDLKYAGEPTELEVGDENQIREFSTLHLGTAAGGGVTRVEDHNLIMANAHALWPTTVRSVTGSCSPIAWRWPATSRWGITRFSAASRQFTSSRASASMRSSLAARWW